MSTTLTPESLSSKFQKDVKSIRLSTNGRIIIVKRKFQKDVKSIRLSTGRCERVALVGFRRMLNQ